MQSSKLGDDFFQDLDHITKQIGGLKGYEDLKNKTGNERNDLNNILGQIDSKIVQTKKDDADFLGQLKQASNGQHLCEYVSFDAANPDLVGNIIGKILFIIIRNPFKLSTL